MQPAETVVEPLTLADIKDWLIIGHDQDDALLQRLYGAVKLMCEHRTKQLLTERLVTVVVSIVDTLLFLPRLPFIELVSVEQRDANADAYTVVDADNYYVLTSEDAININAHGTYKFVYRAGYTTANPTPDTLKQAILSQMADMYENRGDQRTEAVLTGQTVQLLTPYVNPHYFI